MIEDLEFNQTCSSFTHLIGAHTTGSRSRHIDEPANTAAPGSFAARFILSQRSLRFSRLTMSSRLSDYADCLAFPHVAVVRQVQGCRLLLQGLPGAPTEQ